MRGSPRVGWSVVVLFVWSQFNNCYLSGSSADPIFKDLGLRTYAALLNNNSKHDLFGLIVCIVFLTLACFFEGVVVAICLFGIFDIWSKFATEFFQQVKKIRPRVPQERPTSGQRVPPRGSEKQVAQSTRYQTNISSNWLQN